MREQLGGCGEAWLAVHLRRTDKLLQCDANRISAAWAAEQAAAFASALGCRGVLLCTDDAPFKRELASGLAASGVPVATVDALLSSVAGGFWPARAAC